jgi:peptidoglycan/xylan/chitin deacetylase (PgdA/CDA1 family)
MPHARVAAALLSSFSLLGPLSGCDRWPGAATAGPPASRRPVPILMYHVTGDPPRPVAYPELYVRVRDFAGQLRWLEEHRFRPVTLRAVWEAWHGGLPLPPRPIVLTFDDGYRSVAEHALPPLARRGWPAVLNLKVGNIGDDLTPWNIRQMIAAGWELGAHTITHPDLTTLDDRRLQREVGGSRTIIRRRFGVPVDFFCYPSGRYDARVIAAVRRAGFLGATTTEPGLARPDEPFTLRRIRVERSDGVAGLAAKLRAAGAV